MSSSRTQRPPTSAPADLPSLPFSVVRTAAQRCMVVRADHLATLTKVEAALARNRESNSMAVLEGMVSKGMGHVYENSVRVREQMFEQVLGVVEDNIQDEHYTSWSHAFETVLFRYRHSRGSKGDPFPKLSPRTALWEENRKKEVRIWFATLGDSEKVRAIEGMRNTNEHFKGVVKFSVAAMSEVAREKGALAPRFTRESVHEHEEVQHSLSHMTPRQHSRYFSGAATAAGRVGGGGW